MKYFLGRLEQSIMEVLWTAGSATVREVLQQLKRRPAPAYTTVMTVMARLAEDGYLRRQPGVNNSYRYEAIEGREEFAARCSRSNIDELVARYGDVALVQFLSRIEKIPDGKLQRLKRLANKKPRS